MSDNFWKYLIIGVGGVFAILVVAYYLLSKKMQTKETRYIAQLTEGTKKSSFNRETDITIHGIQVEIYVQDIKSQVNSNGIYSICDNDWVKEPKPIKSITKHNTEKEFEKWSDHI